MNFWIGPKISDLVLIGAKYAPCMRKDLKLHQCKQASDYRDKYAKCCVQPQFYNPDGEMSCALLQEESCMAPNLWNPNHIYCNQMVGKEVDKGKYAKCNIVARPCCISMEGRCEIVTKEWCDDLAV